MASKYATTIYNRSERVKSRVRDIFGRATAFHFTADKLTEETAALWASDDFRRLPAYERGYVRGMVDSLREDIWRNHVTWCLGPSTGPTRVVHSEWTEEMSLLCRMPGQLYGGHFWTDDNGSPTAHVFTDYKPTN